MANKTVVGEQLPTTVNYLDNVTMEVDPNTGEVIKTVGYLNGLKGLKGLKVSIYNSHLSIEHSLDKYWYGNNFYTLNRQTTAQVIEKLSDELHFNVGDANVTRLEFGTNFEMKYPVPDYFTSLGSTQYLSKGYFGDSSLYYENKGKSKILRIYDKIADAMEKKMTIPSEYIGTNLLRYEMKYKWRLPQQLGVPEVKASTLSDESFYKRMIDIYQQNYSSISKRKQLKIDAMSEINTPTDAYDMYVAWLISQVDIAQQGEFLKSMKDSKALSSKYNSRLKKEIEDVASKARFTESDELVKELDNKIQAVC